MLTTEHRKEAHLYFVSEDRGTQVYLWDFTEKSKKEFKEDTTSEEFINVASVAKEGAMLIYKNGKYELYSEDGYDIISSEETN